MRGEATNPVAHQLLLLKCSMTHITFCLFLHLNTSATILLSSYWATEKVVLRQTNSICFWAGSIDHISLRCQWANDIYVEIAHNNAKLDTKWKWKKLRKPISKAKDSVCVCGCGVSNVTGFGEISLATLQDGVKKLWPFRTGRLSIPQNFGLTLANVKLNWAIYHCWKWLNIKSII